MVAQQKINPFLWALGVGVVAFFLDLSAVRFETLKGQPNCDYIDAVAMFVGFGLIAFGYTQLKKRPFNPVFAGMSLALAVLGIVHLLRSVGYITGPCA